MQIADPETGLEDFNWGFHVVNSSCEIPVELLIDARVSPD